MPVSPASAHATNEDLVTEIGRKYLWWEPVGEHHEMERTIAQIMDIGTYADIRRLETALNPERLADVMLRAQPGSLSARSWEFWRGRLSIGTTKPIPLQPPRRAFLHAGTA